MKEEEFALIERILDGETDLYAHFVTNYNKDIFQLAFQLTKDRELSEDLTQDIFVKGFLKLSSFQQKSQFLTWLYRIAYNLIVNELRKRKVIFSHFDDEVISHEEIDEIDDFFDKKETEHRYQKLDEALQTLSKDEYVLILFHYYEQKTIDEMAFITEQTAANVKVKLFRIRKKLYNIMRYE
ncbi:MAG: RNA polymerase sigma factor [Bacteroidetes bacterium]|nr:RNA polymerase sigma factor [Bacteroidota bacterium]MCL2303433.1 RNA polymerase sigma factor [Lentimicrobiaceae bacterium]